MSAQIKIKSYQICKNSARKKSPETATIANSSAPHLRIDPPVNSGSVAPVALGRRVESNLVEVGGCVLELELELASTLTLARLTTLVVLVLGVVVIAVTVLS